ncbi:MAG TPA: hypothetical protein ENI64_11120 [Gammaproteobacteria bacterium]|nr:hypothetical protein [Gammaproteobacteria bacterium]
MILRFSVFLLVIVASGCASPVAVKPVEQQQLRAATHYELTLPYDNRLRQYNLYIPSNWNEQKKLPVVIMLHSGGGNAAMFEERTGMTRKAETEGFIVVYPQGTGYTHDRFYTWNSGHCCFYALEKQVDDVGFVRELILKLVERLHIDKHRIYVAGFSNGGMLAYRLGAAMPDVLAAIAPLSATIGGRAGPDEPEFRIPAPVRTLPLITMHGLADQQIPYDGGQGSKAFAERTDISVEMSLRYWMQAASCHSGQARSSKISKSTTRYQFACDKTAVELYTLEGMGHAWASEVRNGWRVEYALLDEPDMTVSATDIVWDFFKHHPRRHPSTP